MTRPRRAASMLALPALALGVFAATAVTASSGIPRASGPSPSACQLLHPDPPEWLGHGYVRQRVITKCGSQTGKRGASLKLSICIEEQDGASWTAIGCKDKTLYGADIRGHGQVYKLRRCHGNPGTYRVTGRMVYDVPGKRTKRKTKRSDPREVDCK